jgi:hypothetical protein
MGLTPAGEASFDSIDCSRTGVGGIIPRWTVAGWMWCAPARGPRRFESIEPLCG